MKPVILIPTYVCVSKERAESGVLDTYDRMTPLDRPGELPRCLDSIKCLSEPVDVAVLVVSEKGCEEQAEEKIRSMAARLASDIDISVIGISEESALHTRMLQLGVGDHADGISLTGYGAMRNLGLIYAAVMGYTEAIFIDDDEVVEDPEFVKRGCYGLGMLTQSGVPILIKSGYYLDKKGSYRASERRRWYDRFWRQHKGFNAWIDSAMTGPRISPSNTACGGCLALHREAFRRVSFDPWISRGEDLDFLLNVRMYGSEVWFDNAWHLRRLSPKNVKMEARRFSQDIFRWLYEVRKLEFSNTQIDLLQVPTQALMPYPGPFLEPSVDFSLLMTALLRSIGRSGHRRGYLKAAMSTRREAANYARENCHKYFQFQRGWPEVVAILEGDIALSGIFANARVEPVADDDADGASPEERVRAAAAAVEAMLQDSSDKASGEMPSDSADAESAAEVETESAAEVDAGSGDTPPDDVDAGPDATPQDRPADSDSEQHPPMTEDDDGDDGRE